LLQAMGKLRSTPPSSVPPLQVLIIHPSPTYVDVMCRL
jgi:hypothetical protein